MATFKIVAPMKQEYEFTGADRNGALTWNADTAYMDFVAMDRGGVPICFVPGQDLTILSAKLISGVPGVVAGDRKACAVDMKFGTQDDCQLDESLVTVPIALQEWNKSEKQIKGISGTLLKADVPVFAFIGANSAVNIMDYNVQDDWVGQKFMPSFELIIETDHLLTIDGVALY